MTTRRRCHEHSRCMHSVYLKASAKKRRQTSLKPFLTKSKEMSNGEIMAWNRWMATRWEDRSVNRVGVILCYRTFQYYLNLRLSVIFLMDILAIGNKTHTHRKEQRVYFMTHLFDFVEELQYDHVIWFHYAVLFFSVLIFSSFFFTTTSTGKKYIFFSSFFGHVYLMHVGMTKQIYVCSLSM